MSFSRLLITFSSICLMVTAIAVGGGAGATVAPASAASYRPVTINNCGAKTTYRRAPRRVVGMTQPSTEVLLALGLERRIVGTAFRDSPPLRRDVAAFRQIRVLGEMFPSREAMLGVSADFAMGGLDNFAFAQSQGRSRAALRSVGISPYAFQCASDKGRKLDHWSRRVGELGRIFGVPRRATALTRSTRRQINRVRRAVRGVRKQKVFFYDSGRDQPLTFPGGAIATELADAAGAVNIARNVPGAFGPISWEQVAAANPDAIVILDFFTGPSLRNKRNFLKSFPALRQTTAVRKGRFVVLPFAEIIPGARMPIGTRRLAKALHPSKF